MTDRIKKALIAGSSAALFGGVAGGLASRLTLPSGASVEAIFASGLLSGIAWGGLCFALVFAFRMAVPKPSSLKAPPGKPKDAAPTPESEWVYEQIASELSGAGRQEAFYLRCLDEADGDPRRAAFLYTRARRQELEAANDESPAISVLEVESAEGDLRGKPDLAMAVETQQIDLLCEMLSNDADPNERLHEGRTALHLAVLASWRHGVAELLAHGADSSIRDDLGRTPRDYATGEMYVLLQSGRPHL